MSEQLEIPRDFGRDFRELIIDMTKLRGPNGKIWDVEVEERTLEGENSPAAAANGHGREEGGCRRKTFFFKEGRRKSVRDQEVERGGAVGMGYSGGQLRDLPEPHHASVHRMPGEPGQRHQRRVYGGLGGLQPRFPLPLHQPLA
ncbi:OLC1v1008756C1 [Oldenlandia corymbosa var. corymbosa]|uniref:OLC1v1008756C1 n=1 Tax=Oldenlandia corymbosa var. corymbosa TaxID=529605 RepID=A0AAV1DM94_OLDCO|nr:OLC1v1008756C1 [Oldenlandia corymbosa var. corymbosa]